MDGVALLGEEDRMGHRRVVPLFAVPDLIHRGRSISSRRGGIAADAGGDRPRVELHAVDEDSHLLRRLVDIDEDRGLGRLCCSCISAGVGPLGLGLPSGGIGILWSGSIGILGVGLPGGIWGAVLGFPFSLARIWAGRRGVRSRFGL